MLDAIIILFNSLQYVFSKGIIINNTHTEVLAMVQCDDITLNRSQRYFMGCRPKCV